MGHRMEIYVNEKTANKIISISKSFGIEAQVVGRVESSPQKQVTLTSPAGIFIYH